MVRSNAKCIQKTIQCCYSISSIQQNELFYQKIWLKFWEETLKCCIWNKAFYIAETGTLWKVDQKHVESSKNLVLEKNGEEQMDRLCEKLRSVTDSQGEKEYPTCNKRRKSTGLAVRCVGSVFWNTLLREIIRRDRDEGRTRKKTQAATGWPEEKKRILEIEKRTAPERSL